MDLQLHGGGGDAEEAGGCAAMIADDGERNFTSKFRIINYNYLLSYI